MAVEFFISGGQLRIDKKIFIREMLRPDSVMKRLLNYTLEDCGKTRSLTVDKSSADQVVMNFNFVDDVAVGQDYQELLETLKKELQSHIKGKITLIMDSAYERAYFTIDFNSDGSDIEQRF